MVSNGFQLVGFKWWWNSQHRWWRGNENDSFWNSNSEILNLTELKFETVFELMDVNHNDYLDQDDVLTIFGDESKKELLENFQANKKIRKS